MPVYDFQHEESGQIIAVLVRLDEPDTARQEQTVDGKVYKRVYSASQISKDTKVGDATLNDFTKITTDKNLSVGTMWDISKEMSAKRAEKNGGIDPVQQKFYDDYKKKMGGEHENVKKARAAEKRKKLMEEMGVRIES